MSAGGGTAPLDLLPPELRLGLIWWSRRDPDRLVSQGVLRWLQRAQRLPLRCTSLLGAAGGR